jgi:predicted nucleotide-binding protein
MLDGKYRARQNVIFELGYFVAKLGRENVIALYTEDGENRCEIPSDISGVLYEPYTADGA